MRMSLPARGAWIEIASINANNTDGTSLPARGAWIEIKMEDAEEIMAEVAPRTGSVD